MNRDILPEIALVVLIVLNIPFYLFLGKRFFGNWAGFWAALRFWFTPQIVSALRGEFHDDIWAELKLWIFFVICAFLLTCEFALIYLWLMSRG